MEREARVALVLAALLSASAGRANGRFPQAQHLVAGPGARDDLVLVRATFGLMLSDDGGQRFRFLCEDPWGFLDGFDPAVILGSRASMLVGIHNGLTRSRDGCAPARDPDLDGLRVVDLAADVTGRVVVAAAVAPGPPSSRVARSDDGGERFEVLPARFDGVTLSTLEVGSADGMTLYASGVEGESRAPGVWRSDDGGARWSRTLATFDAGSEVFISAVHPTLPRVLYARVNRDGDGGLGGTSLLRSDDGGDRFVVVGQTRGPMQGFAMRGDGRALWIGGPVDGLLRSDDGGPFRAISSERVECLRWHAGTLWACGSFAPGAVMLWRARGDEPLSPALRWNELEAPPSRCAPGTPLREICPARWQVLRGVIAPDARDAGLDGGADAGAAPPPTGGCGCHASGGRGGAAWWLLALWRRRQKGRPGAG